MKRRGTLGGSQLEADWWRVRPHADTGLEGGRTSSSRPKSLAYCCPPMRRPMGRIFVRTNLGTENAVHLDGARHGSLGSNLSDIQFGGIV